MTRVPVYCVCPQRPLRTKRVTKTCSRCGRRKKIMNEEREKTLEQLQIFHKFLQGTIPEGVSTCKIKKMNAKQAFTVIWFLQEVCQLIDGSFEMCDNCYMLFDSWSEGCYIEKKGKNYCGTCDPRALTGI